MSMTRRTVLQVGTMASLLPTLASSQTNSEGASGAGRIDVHSHFIPDFYREAVIAAGHGKPDGMPGIPPWSEEKMLASLDQLGIEKTHISISSPGIHFGDNAAARDLAMRVNDEAARLKQAHPGRVGFYASLPLPDVEGAIAEVNRVYDDLDADGIVFMSNFNGTYLSAKELEPLYEVMNVKKALLFVHPTSPGSMSGDDANYSDINYPRPMIEFLFDTTRSITDLVVSGVLDRWPDLRVLVPHAGAALPLFAARVDGLLRALPITDGPAPSLQGALKKMHFDLAGLTNTPQLSDEQLAGIMGGNSTALFSS